MKPVVYIDVLFMVNFFINFLLLYITAYLAKRRPGKLRFALGAGLGAVYACFMFFPQLKALYVVPAKLSMSLLIVLAAFKTDHVRPYVRTVITFYLASFILGGVTLALLYFTGAGVKTGTILSNGIFYFNLPWKVLFLSTGAAYGIIKLALKVYRFNRAAEYKAVTVQFGEKRASLSALVDTGNLLEDPLSHNPVVVAEFDGLKNLLPGEILDVYQNNRQDDLETITAAVADAGLSSRFRLIPFTSLGAQNGLLLGFRPDFITVENKSRTDVTVGIYNQPLSKNHSYNALLNPEIIL